MSHLLDFTHRTHQVLAAEQLTRTSTEFTADNVFVQTVITIDLDLVDTGLPTFKNSHFQVNGVIIYVYFHRIQCIEQITIIIIEVTDSIFVG